jgi:hypothetical protein
MSRSPVSKARRIVNTSIDLDIHEDTPTPSTSHVKQVESQCPDRNINQGFSPVPGDSIKRNEESIATSTSTQGEEEGWKVVNRRRRPDSLMNENLTQDPGDQTQRSLLKISQVPREHCLMVFRLPESAEVDPDVRYDDDIKAVAEIVDKILDVGDEGITLIRAVRIGKLKEGTSTPRPLKLVLGSSEEVRRLLSKGYKLRGTPWYIRPDLAPEDRERQRSAVMLLKTKRANGETNLHIKDFQVVRKRLLKAPVLLRPGVTPGRA